MFMFRSVLLSLLTMVPVAEAENDVHPAYARNV